MISLAHLVLHMVQENPIFDCWTASASESLLFHFWTRTVIAGTISWQLRLVPGENCCLEKIVACPFPSLHFSQTHFPAHVRPKGGGLGKMKKCDPPHFFFTPKMSLVWSLYDNPTSIVHLRAYGTAGAPAALVGQRGGLRSDTKPGLMSRRRRDAIALIWSAHNGHDSCLRQLLSAKVHTCAMPN